MSETGQDGLLERARRSIQDLRQRLSEAEARNQGEPVAVIGMGARLPGSGSDLAAFWKMLAEGRDAVVEVPPDRWRADAFFAAGKPVAGKSNTRRGGFLDEVRRFDASFFDIAPREAARMDPQQRIFLETSWHALEHAGLPRERVAGTDTGVYVGVHTLSTDYQAMQFGAPGAMDAYAGTGVAHEMIAGRLAFWLDLHGPAAVINTACSSSLAAVHLACRALRSGECGLAIAGGINLMLEPTSTVALAQMGMLAADGRSKTFDARADGMGRGEGCGVVILKGLRAALRDGDRVLAVVAGSAMNQDGRTNGLTAPNGRAQARVLGRALADADVEPWQIGYVETHGTGTRLGDPIEVEALGSVLADERRTGPCTLGALKANIGHLEGAAGVVGLIKAVMVLQHRWLPPVAQLGELNPYLPDTGETLRIPREGAPWTADSRRFAGVSSFGWSGTNVHVVLGEAPGVDGSGLEAEEEGRCEIAAPAVASGADETSDPASAAAPEPAILLVSAQSPAALRVLLARFAERVEGAEDAELADIGYTAAARRTHFRYRVAAQGRGRAELARNLRQRAELEASEIAASEVERTAAPAAPAAPVAPDDSETTGGRELRDRQRAAQQWEAGGEVDWTAICPMQGRDGHGRLTDLPAYPFQGMPMWLEERPVRSEQGVARPAQEAATTVELGADDGGRGSVPGRRSATVATAAAAEGTDGAEGTGRWRYRTEWVADPAVAAGPLRSQTAGQTWLLIRSSWRGECRSGEGLADRVAEMGRQAGDTVLELRRGAEGVWAEADRIALPIQTSLTETLQAVAGEHPELRHAIFVAESERGAADADMAFDAAEAGETAAAEALEVMQALVASGARWKLWFLTEGAEAVEAWDGVQAGTELPTSVAGAAVRGMGRSFGLEHPELAGGTVDADPSPSAGESLRAVREAILRGSGTPAVASAGDEIGPVEDRIAIRDGQRWVARLRRLPSGGEGGEVDGELRLREDRTYLVTGAFGRLGLEVASALLRWGARHLLLMGRRAPADLPGNRGQSILRQIEGWREEKNGVSIDVAACDVADGTQVGALLDRVAAAGRPVAGVVHAAAAMRFVSLGETTREDVRRAFRAKVRGAQVLEHGLRDQALDFFVVFGSAAATVGLRNGLAYAAANSALKAVAARRLRRGQSAMCVEWGMWDQVAAESDADQAQFDLIERSGFRPMHPGRALAAMGGMLAAGEGSGLVADIDWAVLGPALELRGRQALVADLIWRPAPVVATAGETGDGAANEVRTQAAEGLGRTPASEAGSGRVSGVDRLCGLSSEERRRCLTEMVAAEVRRVFGLGADEPLEEGRGLFDLGMDSLMSVALKLGLEAQLGMRLPDTLTLTYPTIQAIGGYLDGTLPRDGAKEASGEAAGESSGSGKQAMEPDGRDLPGEVAAMSDAEVDRAIAEEIRSLGQRLGIL